MVSAGTGSSATGLSAYISREDRLDQVTGEQYEFAHKAADLVATGVALPKDAPEWAKDGKQLWTKATEADLTKDRKTGEMRFKKNANIAKHFVLALPKECTDAERQELTERFAKEMFADKGVAVEWGIHQPDGPNENHHAHLLVSTRRLDADGFGNKARDLEPSFATKGGKAFVSSQSHWEHQWTDFQNAYFEENGIDLTVDPFKIVPEEVLGTARFIEGGSELEAKNANALEELQKALRETPALILEHTTERAATFTKRDVVKQFHVHGIEGAEADELAEQALQSPDLLELFDKGTERATGRYTTAQVRQQEEQTLSNVRDIANQPASRIDRERVEKVAADLTFKPEQKAALDWQLSHRFSITQGDPGTGKSHEMKGLRLIKEEDGAKVFGCAPTNTVAADMRNDGFAQADTLHATLYKLDKGKIKLDAKSVLIVDEAAMTETGILHRLTEHCAASGAELHIVGDDKQLGAVGRGGIYSELRKEFGDARLSEISRQKEGWAKAASEDLAAGRVREAVNAYEAHGCIDVTASQEEARQKLASEWNGKDFVFASTNKAVDDMNARLREKAMMEMRLVDKNSIVFQTAKGDLPIARGDRVQMHGNDKKAGIYNGTVATVIGFETSGKSADIGVKVRFDDGRETTLPNDFKQFGYGYAGTVYRGQGKTMQGAVALHDSPMGWSSESGLVGFTRHKERFKLYTSTDVAKDKDAFIKQLSRSNFKSASVAYDAKPVEERKHEQPRDARGRFTNRFNEKTVARSGETLASAATLDSVPSLRSRTVAHGREDAESVLPDHEIDKLRQRPAAQADGLRRPGYVAPQRYNIPISDISAPEARAAQPQPAEQAKPSGQPTAPQVEISQEQIRAGMEAARQQYELQKTIQAGMEQARQQYEQQKAALEAQQEAARQAELARQAAIDREAAQQRQAATEALAERSGPTLSM